MWGAGVCALRKCQNCARCGEAVFAKAPSSPCFRVMGWPCVCSGMPNLRLVVACGRGPLSVVVQVGVLVPGLLLVEFSRARGHVVDFLQFFSSMLPLVSPVVARSANGEEPLSPSKIQTLRHSMDSGVHDEEQGVKHQQPGGEPNETDVGTNGSALVSAPLRPASPTCATSTAKASRLPHHSSTVGHGRPGNSSSLDNCTNATAAMEVPKSQDYQSGSGTGPAEQPRMGPVPRISPFGSYPPDMLEVRATIATHL